MFQTDSPLGALARKINITSTSPSYSLAWFSSALLQLAMLSALPEALEIWSTDIFEASSTVRKYAAAAALPQGPPTLMSWTGCSSPTSPVHETNLILHALIGVQNCNPQNNQNTIHGPRGCLTNFNTIAWGFVSHELASHDPPRASQILPILVGAKFRISGCP